VPGLAAADNGRRPRSAPASRAEPRRTSSLSGTVRPVRRPARHRRYAHASGLGQRHACYRRPAAWLRGDEFPGVGMLRAAWLRGERPDRMAGTIGTARAKLSFADTLASGAACGASAGSARASGSGCARAGTGATAATATGSGAGTVATGMSRCGAPRGTTCTMR